MNISFKKIALSLSVFVLASCSALDYKQGTEVSESAYNSFQNNKTSLTQVRSQFGEPQKLRTEGQNTVYVYNRDTISSNPLSGNKSVTVVLTFNKDGFLINKERRDNDHVLYNPLTGN